MSAAGDDDELDDQKAAAVETAMAAPDTVADFDLGAYHARLAQDNAPTVRCRFALVELCHPSRTSGKFENTHSNATCCQTKIYQ